MLPGINYSEIHVQMYLVPKHFKFYNLICSLKDLKTSRTIYSQTCIKRLCIKWSPSIKRSVVKVPKISPLNYSKVTSIKWSPLLSGHGHLLQSPSEGISIVFTCIKRSLHKRKPYERAFNVVIFVIKSIYFF